MPKSNSLIGVDIGTSHTKIVAINKSKKTYALERYAILPSKGLASNILSDDEKQFKDAVNYLKVILKDSGFTQKNVIGVIPEHRIFSKVITMPIIEGKAFHEAVEWEAEQHLPHSVSDVYLKYKILAENVELKRDKKSDIVAAIKGKSQENAKGTMDILLVASPKTMIDKYLKFYKEAELELDAMEPASLACIRSLIPEEEPVSTIIIDYGYENANLFVIVDNHLQFVRTINFGVLSLIRAISQQLEFSHLQAADYLFTYGMSDDELNGKIKAAIEPVVKIVVDEIEKTRKYIEGRLHTDSSNTDKKIKRVILSGGGALIPNLMVYFIQEVNLQVEYADPWKKVDLSQVGNVQFLESIGPLLSASLGAGLKED